MFDNYLQFWWGSNFKCYCICGRKWRKKCIKINKKNQDENRNAIQGNIGLINNGLNKQEKQLKKEIMDYTKHFKNAKSDKIKFDIIINYNKLIIEYLIF